jgi:hypothetical protein
MTFLRFYLRILFDLPADLSKLFPAEITYKGISWEADFWPKSAGNSAGK